MADTGDLKSPAEFPACGFESRLRHQTHIWHIPNLRLKKRRCGGANLEYGKFAPFTVDSWVRIVV